jgi:hypothetical protein
MAEIGFYYNQPYYAYVSAVSDYVIAFFYENGVFNLNFPNTGRTESGTFTISEDCVVLDCPLGTFNAIASADGTEVHIVELSTTFQLTDMSVADEDYIYVRTSYGNTDCYVVSGVIDKTKTQYGLIRTGIYGLPTLQIVPKLFIRNTNLTKFVIPNCILYISESAFQGCTSLTNITIPPSVFSFAQYAFAGCTNLTSVTIPASVTHIDSLAFGGCEKLTSITFEGTVEQWNAIHLYTAPDYNWNKNVPATYVQCSDGQVAL